MEIAVTDLLCRVKETRCHNFGIAVTVYIGLRAIACPVSYKKT